MCGTCNYVLVRQQLALTSALTYLEICNLTQLFSSRRAEQVHQLNSYLLEAERGVVAGQDYIHRI